MGQEKPGYVRTYGLVPNPSDVLGSTSSLSEAKMIATAEMSKMVEKNGGHGAKIHLHGSTDN